MKRGCTHSQDYATEGLRTLCLAYRNISDAEYAEWSELYDNAAAQMSGRAEALDNVAEAIEQNLQLLGATAIEDKLQDGVPDAIHTLQQAGIKVSARPDANWQQRLLTHRYGCSPVIDRRQPSISVFRAD